MAPPRACSCGAACRAERPAAWNACLAWRAALAVLVFVAAGEDPQLLDLRKVEYSNLGGKGPSQHVEEAVRYSRVASINGTLVDMVIICISMYVPADPRQNGRHWGAAAPGTGLAFGTVNLAAGTEAALRVHFYEEGTSEPVRIPSFYFSVYALDLGPDGAQLEIGGFTEVTLANDTKLLYRRGPEGIFFASSTAEDSGEPASPKNLTDKQMRYAATFLYEDTDTFPLSLKCLRARDGDSWTLRFSSAPISGAGVRSLSMSALLDPATATPTTPSSTSAITVSETASSATATETSTTATQPTSSSASATESSSVTTSSTPTETSSTTATRTSSASAGRARARSTRTPHRGCDQLVTCELRLKYILNNNLGGVGPDQAGAPNIRYGSVCQTDAGSLDLVLTAESDPIALGSSGMNDAGPYGLILVQPGLEVALKARFVQTGTDTAVTVGSFLLSFLDLDGATTVTLFAIRRYLVATNSSVQHQPLVNGVVFQGANESEKVDAPADPLHCTAEQERRTALVLFEGVSEFTIRLAAGPGSEPRGFLFGGRACLLTEHCRASDALATAAAEPSSAAPPAPAASVGGAAGGGPSEEEQDCSADLATWRTSWNIGKKLWCCAAQQLGCYGCVLPGDSWTPDERDFCCNAHGLGCPAAAPEGQGELPFDCHESLATWRSAWSVEKKEWCCHEQALGCYDCTGDQSEWPQDRAQWCCEAKQTGCSLTVAPVGAEYYDCRLGTTAWPPLQQQWCCEHLRVGCELLPEERPYECKEGLADWEQGWSVAKKDWCCVQENVGCAGLTDFKFQRKFQKPRQRTIRTTRRQPSAGQPSTAAVAIGSATGSLLLAVVFLLLLAVPAYLRQAPRRTYTDMSFPVGSRQLHRTANREDPTTGPDDEAGHPLCGRLAPL